MTAIELAHINDGGAQMRVEMQPETVDEYATEMLNGASFPPVIVYHDGTDYWLGDGFHRVEAARKIERETIEADIREGTARDAIIHGIGANAAHGLRRTQADKRRAVERLLADPEWARWSDRKIAEVAKVDHKTVGKVRRELSGEIPTPQPQHAVQAFRGGAGDGSRQGQRKSGGNPLETGHHRQRDGGDLVVQGPDAVVREVRACAHLRGRRADRGRAGPADSGDPGRQAG